MSPQRNWLDLVYARLSTHQSNRPGIGLGLTIRFGLESQSFLQFGLIKRTIRVGIKEAELIFTLNDTIMPDDDWLFDEPILPAHEVLIEAQKLMSTKTSNQNRRQSTSTLRLDSKSSATSVGVDLDLEQLSNISTDKGQSKKNDQVRSEKFRSLFLSVQALGGQENPRWLIRSPPGMEVLIGAIIKTQHFAHARPVGGSPRISLQLRIPPHAIVIESANGGFDTINKRIIAHRRITRDLTKEPLILNEISLTFESLK